VVASYSKIFSASALKMLLQPMLSDHEFPQPIDGGIPNLFRRGQFKFEIGYALFQLR
jgi:hypothetical protein